MARMAHVAHRHLMRSKRSLGPFAVDKFRTGPTFRRAQNYHRPKYSLLETIFSRATLDPLDFDNCFIECRGHQLMHLLRIVAFNEIRRVAVAAEKRFELVTGNSRQDRGTGNLVAIQVQDRQYRAVTHWVEKLVRVPTGSE